MGQTSPVVEPPEPWHSGQVTASAAAAEAGSAGSEGVNPRSSMSSGFMPVGTARGRRGFTPPCSVMTAPGLGVTHPLIMDETERQSEGRGWDTAKTLAEALPYIQI